MTSRCVVRRRALPTRAGGEGDRAVPQADEPVVGESDLEDLRSAGGESGVAVVLGLRVDVPGDGPDLGRDGARAGQRGAMASLQRAREMGRGL